MQIGARQFCGGFTISQIGGGLQFSTFKTFHPKRIGKACFVKSMLFGLVEPMPAFFNIFEIPA